jgi:putative DNA primase/helicase
MQIPPQEIDAEASLISACLLDNAVIPEVLDIIQPSDCYRTAHQVIFTAIRDLHRRGDPADLVTVAPHLKAQGKLKAAGGSDYIAQILDNAPLAVNAPHYAKIIRAEADKRRALEITNRFQHDIEAGAEVHRALRDAVADLERITATDTSNKASVRAADLAEFLSLQIPPRDFVLAPIIPTQGLVMLYAPRGIGKTLLALFMAYSIATGQPVCRWSAPSPRRVLYIDGEMPAATMQDRLASIIRAYPKEPAPGYFTIITPDLQEKGINLATSAGQAAVESHVEAAEVIFVDNLATLCRSGRENETESWHPVQDWILQLRRRGKAVSMVHHSNKTGGQRGTSSREDVLDTVAALRHPSDYMVEQGARFEVHLEKARGIVGTDARPFEAHLVTDEYGIMQWVCRDIEDAEAETVCRLKEEGLSVRDIASETGLSKSKVHRLLRKGGTV